MCVKFSTVENPNCFPFNKYKVVTGQGEKVLVWGDKEIKKIHVKIEEIDSAQYQQGMIITNGFYVFKKDERIAPIGFGDHKESIKLTEYKVSLKDQKEILIPVVIKGDSFYILITEASDIIKEYQPNEPLIVDRISNSISKIIPATLVVNPV